MSNDRRVLMIYYLFSEKERIELEDLLINEMTVVNDLLQKKEEVKEKSNAINLRAIEEKRKILLGLFKKISSNKKTFN
jgi:hypothetical protein